MNRTEYQQKVWPLRDRMYRFALRLLDDRAEAEDVVQEVLIKLWNTRDKLDQIGSLEAWSLRLTRNLAIDKMRGAYRKRKTDLADIPEPVQRAESPAERAQYLDTYAQIQQLLKQLPEKQRMVFQLRDIEDFSYQDIADALDLTLAQVKVNLHRARVQLRAGLLKTYEHGI